MKVAILARLKRLEEVRGIAYRPEPDEGKGSSVPSVVLTLSGGAPIQNIVPATLVRLHPVHGYPNTTRKEIGAGVGGT
jgi:hypothetical protein